MIVPALLATVFYVFVVFFCARSYLKEERNKKKNQIELVKKTLESLENKKEDLCSQKINLQAEASNIFALYEITKDIANVLHEEEAFKVFKKKLSDHVQFVDCRIFKPGDTGVEKYKKDADYHVFPLKTTEQELGFFVLRGITEEEKEKTTILAAQFLLALRRVRLYQEIENIATTDSLTEVYTRRYTFERLTEELKRSKAQKLNLAVLMIDVDHFKKVNDTYGHLTGDQVLREMAQKIKANLREIDIAGRYGGEEFCVVLPDTDNDGAQFAAERIRQAAEIAPIQAYDNAIRATVSIGICQYPKDGQKPGELLDKADWALYRAKKQGRNRVCSFGVYPA